eukprot:9489668-Pyramimonas_sp.AAC.1
MGHKPSSPAAALLVAKHTRTCTRTRGEVEKEAGRRAGEQEERHRPLAAVVPPGPGKFDTSAVAPSAQRRPGPVGP